MSLFLFPIVYHVSQLIKSTIVSSQKKKKKTNRTTCPKVKSLEELFPKKKKKKNYNKENFTNLEQNFCP